MFETIFMKLGMCVMAPEPISTAYFINPSHQSVRLCIPLSLLGNGSVNTFPRQRRIVDVVLYAVHVASKESRRISSSQNLFSLSLQRKVSNMCLLVSPWPSLPVCTSAHTVQSGNHRTELIQFYIAELY
jgi:hypothetical protein